jgi:hypothetical protein
LFISRDSDATTRRAMNTEPTRFPLSKAQPT